MKQRIVPGRRQPVRDSDGSSPSWRWVGTLVLMIVGAMTAYYTTVYGIRLTVNEKADRVTVVDLNLRLVTIETILRTDVARREDLFRMQSAFDRRLIAIETLLERTTVSP